MGIGLEGVWFNSVISNVIECRRGYSYWLHAPRYSNMLYLTVAIAECNVGCESG
jgi:hypothetical protein